MGNHERRSGAEGDTIQKHDADPVSKYLLTSHSADPHVSRGEREARGVDDLNYD